MSEQEAQESEDYWSTPEGIQVRLDFLGHDVVWSSYNEASQITLRELGASWVEWVTEITPRTCDYCDRQSGRRYHLGQFVPKLPRHPNCRCWWQLVS
jgi:hypothetical protein